MVRVPFAVHSYRNDDLPASKQRTLNMYAEGLPANENSPVAVIGVPGMPRFGTVGLGPCRGFHTAVTGVPVFVSGTGVYTVTSDGVGTLRGSIEAGGRVGISENAGQIVIVTGNKGYVLTKSTWSFAEITDPDFPGADTVDFLDQYGIFSKPDSGEFFLSALNDLTDIDALDFASAESSPDDLIAAVVDHREAWLFGSCTTEVWTNTGNATFPFERLNNVILSRGLAAPHAVTKMDNTIFWLGEDGTVYRAEGFTPKRISTHAVEAVIENSDLSGATMFSYTEKGHKFCCLTLSNITDPNVSASWVYDAATDLWHERETFGKGRWRAENHTVAFGKNLVGDFENGNIYELSRTNREDDGGIQQAILISPAIGDGITEFCITDFQVDIRNGVGLTTGQGSDPQAMLRWSDDNGNTWSNELWRSMGKIGEYGHKTIWEELGASTRRIWELTITDPVDRSLMAANARIEVND